MLCKFGEKEYLKSTHTDLMGKKITAFVSEDQKCEAKCRGDGVTVKIEREISTMKDAENFLVEIRGLLSAAWTARQELKPKFSRTLSGH